MEEEEDTGASASAAPSSQSQFQSPPSDEPESPPPDRELEEGSPLGQAQQPLRLEGPTTPGDQEEPPLSQGGPPAGHGGPPPFGQGPLLGHGPPPGQGPTPGQGPLLGHGPPGQFPGNFPGNRGPPRMPSGRPPPLMGARIPHPHGHNGPRGPPPGGFHGYPDNSGPPRFQHMGGGPPHSQHEGGGGGHAGLLPDPIDELWIETKTAEGKSYFYHAKTRETVWTKPDNVRVVSQGEFEDIVRQNAAKHGQQMGPPMGGGGFGPGPSGQHQPAFPPPGSFPPMMPPPGGGGGWPPFPPPFMGGMPPFNMPMGPGGGPGPMDFNDPAAVWSEYTTPEGRPYYFNMATGETIWDKPQALRDREARQSGKGPSSGGGGDGPSTSNKPGSMLKMAPLSAASTSFGGAGVMQEGERNQEQQQKSDVSKPISNNPVAGTPWCVVWTGDHKVFFYNPSTRTSVWERPPELYGRPDVDLLVSKPPEPKKVEDKKDDLSDRSPMMEEEEQQPPPKKKKKNKGGQSADVKPKPEPVKPKEPEPKVEHQPPPPKIRDAAMEAEVKAAQERAQVPLEVRIQQFKDMLREKEVSAFSTWEKELHKIVFDPRYLLLTSKERRSVFEQYVKDRAEEERSERKKKSKEAKENYKNLLSDSNLHGKSSFNDFASKYGKDERFKGIEKSKDRESMFNDYVGELRKKEREEKAVLREKLKTDFVELLKEQENIRKYTKWSDLKKTSINDDRRFKAVDSSSLREDWFKEYLKGLPSADSDDEEEEARKERLKHKDKKDREEAAKMAREAEVAAELESQMKERDKEMEKHKCQESEEDFRALLADMVKTTDQSWRDWKRQLRKDHRWESADLLDRHQKEHLFEEHVKMLEHKKREVFYQLLDETPAVGLTSSWKEVRKAIKDDPRMGKFSSSDRKCEREYKEYLQEKLIAAKNDFRELLKETKIITFKSKQMIQENEQHLKDILATLENDKRYLILECCPDEREKLLESYLDELDKRGPPPPPTASEPSRRGK